MRSELGTTGATTTIGAGSTMGETLGETVLGSTTTPDSGGDAAGADTMSGGAAPTIVRFGSDYGHSRRHAARRRRRGARTG